MIKTRSILISSASVVVGKLLTNIITAGAMMYVARCFGKESYGKISVALAYLFMFQVISQFGIDSIFVRQISREPAQRDKWLANALACKIALACIALLLSWGVLAFASYSAEIKMLIGIASISMFFSFSSLIPGMFQSELRTIYYVAPDIGMGLLTSALTIAAAIQRLPIAVIVAIQALGIIPVTAIYLYNAHRYLGVRFNSAVDVTSIRYLVRESFPLFLSSVMLAVSLRLDQIILYSVMDEKALGLYAAAVKVVEIPNFIPTSLLSVIYPVMSASYAASHMEFNKLCEMAFKYMSILSLPLAFGIAMLSGSILELIYGRDFSEAAVPLSCLSVSIVFVFLGSLHSNILMARGLQSYLAFFTFYGACLSGVLYVWLIPRFGVYGAALATSISYSGFGMLPQFLIKQTRSITVNYYKSIVKALPASLLMSLFIFLFKDNNLYLVVLLSVAVYVISLLLTKAVNVTELKYFISLLGIKKIDTDSGICDGR